MFQGRLREFSVGFKVIWKNSKANFREVSKVFQGCFKEVSRVFQGSFKGVTRKFSGFFKKDWRVFQWSFKWVSIMFKRSWMDVWGKLPRGLRMYHLHISSRYNNLTTFNCNLWFGYEFHLGDSCVYSRIIVSQILCTLKALSTAIYDSAHEFHLGVSCLYMLCGL